MMLTAEERLFLVIFSAIVLVMGWAVSTLF